MSMQVKPYVEKVQAEQEWRWVRVRSLWLEVEDYPWLLGAVDFGISMPESSSDLDLPMKVVDMYGRLLASALDSAWCVRRVNRPFIAHWLPAAWTTWRAMRRRLCLFASTCAAADSKYANALPPARHFDILAENPRRLFLSRRKFGHYPDDTLQAAHELGDGVGQLDRPFPPALPAAVREKGVVFRRGNSTHIWITLRRT